LNELVASVTRHERCALQSRFALNWDALGDLCVPSTWAGQRTKFRDVEPRGECSASKAA